MRLASFLRLSIYVHIHMVDQITDTPAGSRRLITYRRIPDNEVDTSALEERKAKEQTGGVTADELNPFRRVYFKGFKPGSEKLDTPPE